MMEEFITIINNYLNNIKLTKLIPGTVVADGVKISDKLTIPLELIKGNMKKCISNGDKVRLIRNYGGQEFYIVEIIDKEFITKGSTIKLSIDGVTRSYKVEDVIK